MYVRCTYLHAVPTTCMGVQHTQDLDLTPQHHIWVIVEVLGSNPVMLENLGSIRRTIRSQFVQHANASLVSYWHIPSHTMYVWAMVSRNISIAKRKTLPVLTYQTETTTLLKFSTACKPRSHHAEMREHRRELTSVLRLCRRILGPILWQYTTAYPYLEMSFFIIDMAPPRYPPPNMAK